MTSEIVKATKSKVNDGEEVNSPFLTLAENKLCSVVTIMGNEKKLIQAFAFFTWGLIISR